MASVALNVAFDCFCVNDSVCLNVCDVSALADLCIECEINVECSFKASWWKYLLRISLRFSCHIDKVISKRKITCSGLFSFHSVG